MTNTGDFFAIDANAFSKVCAFGANAAAAYLILARGTGGDNRTTAWSAEAVQARTGMTWRAAKAEIDKLLAAGLITLKPASTKARPRYDLPPILPPRPGLGGAERKVVGLVSQGKQPDALLHQQRAAKAAARKGYLVRKGAAWELTAEPKPSLIWLPNALVDGAASEVAPVERLRRSRDQGALLLLADLYLHHDLANEGGIDRRYLDMSSKRTLLRRVEGMNIWKFDLSPSARVGSGPGGAAAFNHHRERDESGRWNWDRFFRRLSRLEEAGLVEWTLYLVEGGEEDHAAGLIAPIGVLEGAARHSIRRDGPEWDLRRYGARAALCLLAGTEEDDALEAMTQSWEESARSTLVALDRDYAEANLVAIARMRYRPRTAPTASWWGDVTSTCSDLMAVYREITRQRRPGLLAFEAADIKGVSKEHQGWDQSDINGTYDRVASVAHPSGALALSF